jgi:hypothetical protein
MRSNTSKVEMLGKSFTLRMEVGLMELWTLHREGITRLRLLG